MKIILIIFICINFEINSFYGFNTKKSHKDGDVKLIDGTSKKDGTVLVYRGYGWGAICDDNWTIKEANVICKQLQMTIAVKHYTRNYFRTSEISNYLMDDVYCFGNETKIIDCKFGGWGVHDCRSNEHVGVECYTFPAIKKIETWNPFNMPSSKQDLLEMKKNRFEIMIEDIGNYTGIIVTKVNNIKYPLCPLNFQTPESNVLCRQLYGKLGGIIKKIPIDKSLFVANKYFVRLGKCYGNESNLSECITFTSITGLPCDSQEMIHINCTTNLPDIRADYAETERSSYLERLNLWHLKCALSENCLPDSIFGIIERNPNSHPWITRNLLRFSTIIENIGNASFLPHEPPDKWEWHGCHLHYHSMKIFASYEILDTEKRIIAQGHKASFCLEDNICLSGIERNFRCSNTLDNKGTQGLTPGCKDTYLHEYDCQWIDISDIPPGTYIFQMIVNPQFLVGESNFFNNGLKCILHYMGYNSLLRSCSWIHPYDL